VRAHLKIKHLFPSRFVSLAFKAVQLILSN